MAYVITEGEGNGVSFQGLRELQQAAGLTNDEVMELFRACGTGEDADRCIAMLLGNTARAVGDRSSLEGWLEIANGYLESSTDEEHTRVWTIIRDELLEQQGANGDR